MPETPLKLTAADGHSLSATHFTPEGKSRGVVLMLGATAVKQRFYRRFGELLINEGLEAVTVDYRGIGDSKPASLKGFECTYRHWFDLDVPAAFEFAKRRGPVVVVGHSFGGHAFGQLPNPNEALGLAAVASGAAWSGYMTPLERLKVATMWNVIGPVLAATTGYLPGKVWGAEDLPLGVYEDWKRWSQLPHYFFDDPALDMKGLFARVTVPVLGLTARDDAWAPPKSLKTFLSHYANAPLTLETIEPKDYGVKALGHMGPFQRAGLPRLFPRLLRFIDERLAEHHGSRAA
jgi:predicted alpha/beta hydrolase